MAYSSRQRRDHGSARPCGCQQILDDAEKLDLHRYADVTNLVEKDGAMGAAERKGARMSLHGACESAFAVSEEFGLDQGFRELREVQFNERRHEALAEAVLLGVERDESGTTDRRRRGALA